MTVSVRILSILCGILPGLILVLGGLVLINGAVTSFLSYPEVYLNEPHRGLLLIGTLLLSVAGILGFIGLVSVLIGGKLANRTRIRYLWLGVFSAAASFMLMFGPAFFSGNGEDNVVTLALWGSVFLGPIVVGLFHISALKHLEARD